MYSLHKMRQLIAGLAFSEDGSSGGVVARFNSGVSLAACVARRSRRQGVGRRLTNAVKSARFEYRRWPPRRPFFAGVQAETASWLSQIATSPRFLRPHSYSFQLRTLYFVLYLRLTRLDFAAAMKWSPWSP